MLEASFQNKNIMGTGLHLFLGAGSQIENVLETGVD